MSLISYAYLFLVGSLSLFKKNDKRTIYLLFGLVVSFVLGSVLLTDIINNQFFVAFAVAPLLILYCTKKQATELLMKLGIVVLFYYLLRSLDSQSYFLHLFICEISYLYICILKKSTTKNNIYKFHYSTVRLVLIVPMILASYFVGDEAVRLVMIISMLCLIFFYIYPILNFREREDGIFVNVVFGSFLPATILFVLYELCLKVNYLNYIKIENIFAGFALCLFLFQFKNFLFNSLRSRFEKRDLLTSYVLIMMPFLLNQRIQIMQFLSLTVILFLLYEVYELISQKRIRFFLRSMCLITPLNPLFFFIINECRKENASNLIKIALITGLILNQIYFFYKEELNFKKISIDYKQVGFLSGIIILMVIYTYDKI